MKHAGLMYCRLPWRPDEGFVSAHPATRSGIAMGAELSCPIGSPPMPDRAQTGTPLLACTIPPNCHPLAIHPAGPENTLAIGTSYRTLTVKLRPTLKSESPRTILKSHHGVMAERFDAKLSPAKLPDDVSMLLPQVNEDNTCKP